MCVVVDILPWLCMWLLTSYLGHACCCWYPTLVMHVICDIGHVYMVADINLDYACGCWYPVLVMRVVVDILPWLYVLLLIFYLGNAWGCWYPTLVCNKHQNPSPGHSSRLCCTKVVDISIDQTFNLIGGPTEQILCVKPKLSYIILVDNSCHNLV